MRKKPRSELDMGGCEKREGKEMKEWRRKEAEGLSDGWPQLAGALRKEGAGEDGQRSGRLTGRRRPLSGQVNRGAGGDQWLVKAGDRYEGLSEKFLSSPVPKLLLLAGTDRLDRFQTSYSDNF